MTRDNILRKINCPICKKPVSEDELIYEDPSLSGKKVWDNSSKVYITQTRYICKECYNLLVNLNSK